jgi:hypothetical protein
VWTDELDRSGAPAAETLPAQHALMDTRRKLRRLLADAGFSAVSVRPVALSDQPTAEAFFERHASIGATSRRLAGMEDEQARVKFFMRVRARLARLAPRIFATPAKCWLPLHEHQRMPDWRGRAARRAERRPATRSYPLDRRRGHPWLTIGPAAANALRRTTGTDVSW